MNIALSTQIESLKTEVSPEEWDLRVDLAAAYRLIAHHGWDDLIFTHISVRIPGPEHHFLINPYGFLFEEITASSLVKVDLNGKKVMNSPYEINPAGFTIHSAVHEGRDSAKCVMHTHTTNGIAVSAQKEGLLPLSQQSLFCLSSMSYHDYEGVALRDDEKPRLVADLGNANFMILKNHGLLTCAPSIADTFLAMYTLETACDIQIKAQASPDLSLVPDSVISNMMEQASESTHGLGGALAWPALLRKLDRLDSSFRT